MIPPSTNKRFSLDSLFHLDDSSRALRLGLSLAAILLYWILFLLLRPLLGASVTMLMFLPVIAIAWFYGVPGGIFGPIFMVTTNSIVLLLESADRDPSYLLLSLAGWLGFTMVGLLVGRVSSLRKQIRIELEDRRQAQQALQESEERYRVLFENSQTGMLLAEALRETAALLNSSLDLDAVLDAILHNVGKVLPHDAVNIMRVEDGVARILRAEGYPKGEKYEAIMNLRMVVAEVPNLRQMAETQQPLIIPDVTAFPGWLDFPETRWLRSYAGAPVLIDGQIAGYVNLDSATPGFFHSTHTRRLQAFANQAAVAIRNARLYEQAQEQARQMSLLNEITRTAISARDVSQMLDSVVGRIYELFNANSAFITLWDEDLQAPISATASGHLKDVYLSLPPTPQKPSLSSVVLQARRPIAVDDVCYSPYIDPDLPAIFQNRSMLGIPLLVNERKLGAILISYDQVHSCTPEEIVLGEQVAGPIALALAQAQLLERERLRTAELGRANNLISALSRVAARIETRPEPQEVMKTLVSELKLLGLRCLLATTSTGDAALTVRYSSALLEPDSLSPTAAHLLTSFRLLPHNFAIYEELIDRHQVVFLTDPEPLLRRAMKELPVEIVDEILTHASITATTGVAVLPLMVEDQALGMLALWGESMHPEDIPAATLFASQVAIALQNAHLYTEVQQLAVTDELTGLYNRRGLYSLGRREAERALRFQRPLSALMLDIDDFKKFNDQYSYRIGDEIIARLSTRLLENVREVDLVSRYGGDEFIILLVETDLESGKLVANRLIQAISEKPFITSQGDLPVTVTGGLVAFHTDFDSLIEETGSALHGAKQAGQGNWMAVVE